MAHSAGPATTPSPEALVAVPKVTGLEEQQLVPLGFRSQKDLSIVSQQEVWRLLDGCIGSDPALCTMCIRNKAVAPRHASVYTIASDGLTDGYFLASNGSASTTLLLSAERGVRTMARIKLGTPFKVGNEVQLCITRIEYRRQHRSTALQKLTTHTAVSDMFGTVDDNKSAMPGFVLRGLNAMLGAADVGAAMESPRSMDGVGGDDDRFGVEAPNGEVLGGTGGTRSAGSAASGASKPRKRVRFHQAVTNTGDVWPVGPSLYQKQQAAAAAGPGSDKSLHGEAAMKTSYLMMQDHMRVKEDHKPHMVVCLMAMGGDQAGEEFVCRSRNGSIVIGSDPTCDVVITGAEVSPLHARILFSDGNPGHGDLRESLNSSSGKRSSVGSGAGAGAGAGAAVDAAGVPLGSVLPASQGGVKPDGSGSTSDESKWDPFATKSTDFCWIQDLAIGNRHGTQVAVTEEAVALQRGDILVLCRDPVSVPPEGTVITTEVGSSPKDGGASTTSLWGLNTSGTSGGSQGSMGGSMVVREGEVEASRRTPLRKAKRNPARVAAAKKQKQLNGPRVELAILFHSETSHPLVSWSRIALRITRTRRSRRKSIHRTTSERFPSNCVVAGRLGATIGRSPKCDIFIDDLTAANFHAQVVYVQDGYVLQTIADPDYFGTFILLGRKSFPIDRYRHESKGLYQLETNDIFRCGTTEFFVEEIKTESFAEHRRRLASLRSRVKFLRRSPLFSLLPEVDLTRIANAALDVLAMEGQDFITQGDPVDREACFFFIEKGEAGVMIRRRAGQGFDLINKLGPGQCFGEMALLADDRPRAATVRALTEVLAWVLDQQSFRELLGPVMNAAIKLIAKKRETSLRMELFNRLFPQLVSSFMPAELRDLAMACVPVSFKEGQPIVTQDQACNCVFFVVGGRAERRTGRPNGNDAEMVEASSLAPVVKPGSCIGEVSLLFDAPHTCTVVASQAVACLALTRDQFRSLMSPLARWLMAKWGHNEVVKKKLDGIINVRFRSPHAAKTYLANMNQGGSTIDLSIPSAGSEVSGVMDVAAAQHAKAKTDKWRKSSVIKTSGTSLMSNSERSTGGGGDAAAKSDINGSASSFAMLPSPSETDIDTKSNAGDDSPSPAEGVVRVGQSRRGSVQSLPPDTGYKGWEKKGPRERRFSTMMSDFEETASEKEARVAVMAERAQRVRRGLSDASAGAGSGAGAGADGRSVSPASHGHSPGMFDVRGSGTPIFTPREAIPVTSTNPTVEEVKMLSRVPRFLILRALSGPMRGTYFYITSDVTTLGGPGGNATIKMSDRTLSPAHAVIEYQDGAFWLRDQDSTTGTFLKLAGGKDYTMEMGDVFSIGHVELMVLGQPGSLPQPVVRPSKSCCSVV